MRLICPNCDAQYEVDAAMIPAAGRDVQCSNCGKTWFQAPEGAVAEPAPPPPPPPARPASSGLGEEARAFFEGERSEGEDVPETEPEPETESDPSPPKEDAPERQVEPHDTGAPDADDDHRDDLDEDEDEDDDTPPPPPPERPRREIDPAVLGILKAEAEREIAARRAEAQSMETQPDLGLAEPEPAPPPPRSEIEARTARLRGAEDGEGAASARRTVLPDIDEINSTLTATSDRKTARSAPEVDQGQMMKRRAGFRFGFSAVMLVTAVLILGYLYAPQIAMAVPAAEPVLAGYVDWANEMRLSIDGFLERSVERLTALLIDISN